ncbi:MAG: CehA/McbA family metallohydrolase domain-containing protein [Planctomycetota bacterium]|jgi:hypothetical protein
MSLPSTAGRTGSVSVFWAVLPFVLSAEASLTAGPARGASGRFELTVVDRNTGEPLPCRMHLRTTAGRMRRPRNVPFWEDHFVFDGKIVLSLPMGDYVFEMERGPEYVERGGHFTINRFADDSKEVDMLRFVDMSSHGWWSGDLDVRRPVRDIELLMRAEDLHVVPVTTWHNDEDEWSGKPPTEDLIVRFGQDRFYHRMAGTHTWPGGTLSCFNLAAPLVRGSSEYPPPGVYLEEARRGAEVWVDVTKPFWWDLPTLVAHGQVDSIQLAHGHFCRNKVIDHEADGRARDKLLYPGAWGNARWSQAIYFHLLNCGLKIPPSAGSGSGTGPNPVGYNRMYVHVDGDLTYEKWWESLRAGQVVVTNGPLLRPEVRGQLPGHVFYGEPGERLEFQIGLTLSTRRPISYLELIQDGRVAHSIPFDQYAKSGRLPRLEFDRSGWFLVRAATDVSETYRFAMTGPYYVRIGAEPRISKRSAQFFLDWVYERARRIQLDDPREHREVILYHRHARDFWQELVSKANAE